MRVLINIDCQKDFMDNAVLGVPGSLKDVERISSLIDKNVFDLIFASMDGHYNLDISHAAWWRDHNNAVPSPFNVISSDDIKNGKYVPVIDPVGSLRYVEDLEKNGEFIHFLWPEHCIYGSEGASLNPEFAKSLATWMNKNKKWVSFINKGMNPFTEHFGIFRANVPIANDSTTQINQGIFNTLRQATEIVIVGEARTHCVANSLRQMIQIAPELAPKIVVLEDCMSDVLGLQATFYDSVNKIYDDAYALGVKKAKSTDL